MDPDKITTYSKVQLREIATQIQCILDNRADLKAGYRMRWTSVKELGYTDKELNGILVAIRRAYRDGRVAAQVKGDATDDTSAMTFELAYHHFISGFPTIRAAAESLGMSDSQMSNCVSGRATPPAKLLAALGLQRHSVTTVTYSRLQP